MAKGNLKAIFNPVEKLRRSIALIRLLGRESIAGTEAKRVAHASFLYQELARMDLEVTRNSGQPGFQSPYQITLDWKPTELNEGKSVCLVALQMYPPDAPWEGFLRQELQKKRIHRPPLVKLSPFLSRDEMIKTLRHSVQDTENCQLLPLGIRRNGGWSFRLTIGNPITIEEAPEFILAHFRENPAQVDWTALHS